ncbi:MAG: hypothetical protein II857_12330 [Selenomonadaceae bacterium]|nr:hypothetical protein [Selenomonadaceae bacterium]
MRLEEIFMAGNDNRENNKGCLEGLLEIFFVGIIEIIGEILEAIIKKIFEYIFGIAVIVFIIYMIVTFIANHT